MYNEYNSHYIIMQSLNMDTLRSGHCGLPLLINQDTS